MQLIHMDLLITGMIKRELLKTNIYYTNIKRAGILPALLIFTGHIRHIFIIITSIT